GTHRIDWYPAGLLGAVVVVLILSTFDAVLTLALPEHGLATEANPLMASLVDADADVGKFVKLKTALTGCHLIVLVIFSQALLWNRFKAGNTLYPIAALYAALVGYELSLITLV
ncbi:MAG: hypothetical protein ACI9W2_000651, partial [Gammaproteobacteria bacterium]